MTPRLFWQVLCGGAWLNGRAQRCCAPDSSWRAPRICRYPAAWTTPQRRWPLSASTTRVGWLCRTRAPEVWLRQMGDDGRAWFCGLSATRARRRGLRVDEDEMEDRACAVRGRS